MNVKAPEKSATRDELINKGRLDALRCHFDDFVEALDYLRRCEVAMVDVRIAVTDAQRKLIGEIMKRAAQ